MGGTANHAGSGGKAGSGGQGGEDSGAAGDSSAGAGAGTAEGGDAGAGGSAEPPTSPKPTVSITSPTAVTDPDVGPVLVTNDTDHMVTVLCNAKASTEPGALPLDTNSIKIALVDANNQTTVGVARPTNNAGEYAADFELKSPVVSFPAGKVSFSCSASDTSTHPSTATTSIATFVDRGPTITATNPSANTKNALATPLEVDFTTTPALLTPGDTQAAVASTTLKVDGTDISLPAPDANGHYSVAVKLNDKTVFPTSPTGTIPIVIEAKNQRAPTAAASLVSYNIVVDGTPPVISIAQPAENSVVGQQITLQFTITDDLTGVPPTSISVDLNGTEYVYSATDPQWHASTGGGDPYTFTFPSSIIPDPKTQVSAVVHASDGAGNASPGVSREFFIDTAAPIVDLNPAALRERKTISSQAYCSDPFDPVGATSANDSQTVPDAQRFRALVWDTTNSALGQDPNQLHYAGVNTNSVVLYAQPHTNTPLLKNTNGGSQCDTVNSSDATYPAKLLTLNPITAGGSPSFSTASGAIAGVCGVTTQSASAPLCSGTSDLSAVIQHVIPTGSPDPAIFGSGSVCSGDQWFLPQTVASADGWICLVAVATDKAGNQGFSAPLRVCLDAADANGAPFQGSPPCADPSTSPPPSCTDGCTPPAHFNPTYIDQ
jgi:hypothetical protein